MDAHLFRKFCNELEPWLAGGRLEKIQETHPNHLSVTIFNKGIKRHLLFRFGRKEPFCFASSQRLEGPARPSAAVMRIRKYLANGRIQAVVAQYYSRCLWLMVSGNPNAPRNKTVWLCLDLANGATLHFLAENELPEPETPQWPQRDNLAEALADWRQWPVLTPQLRKALLPLDEPERLALLADLEDGSGDVFLYTDEDGKIAKISPWPLAEAANLAEQTREDILQALEGTGKSLVFGHIFEARQKQLFAPGQRRINQLQKLLKKLDADEQRLQKLAAGEKVARILADNLWRLPKNGKSGEVIIPGETGSNTGAVITLDSRFTVGENMKRLFHQAGRGKRGLALLEERRAAALNELHELQGNKTASLALEKPAARNDGEAPSQPPARPFPRNIPRGVQPFWSSDGYLLLRGRDARGNAAVRRMASGHDIWAHVEQGPGAHVVIRMPHPGHTPPERVLSEAGTLAANKSWLNEAAAASVMYAEVRHVRAAKSGPDGKVTIAKLLRTMVAPVDKDLEKRLASE